MKRTILLILFILMTCGIVAVTCLSPSHQSTQPATAIFASDSFAKKSNTISYKGVSFTFEPSLASKEYQNYLRPVAAKLEELPANKFQPNLELLDRLIQSLEVKDK